MAVTDEGQALVVRARTLVWRAQRFVPLFCKASRSMFRPRFDMAASTAPQTLEAHSFLGIIL